MNQGSQIPSSHDEIVKTKIPLNRVSPKYEAIRLFLTVSRMVAPGEFSLLACLKFEVVPVIVIPFECLLDVLRSWLCKYLLGGVIFVHVLYGPPCMFHSEW